MDQKLYQTLNHFTDRFDIYNFIKKIDLGDKLDLNEKVINIVVCKDIVHRILLVTNSEDSHIGNLYSLSVKPKSYITEGILETEGTPVIEEKSAEPKTEEQDNSAL